MREDAATEADLVAGGYRDRLLTELAQNAADAATKSAELSGTSPAGRLRVWLESGRVHVANTGSPLDRSGVEALAALRASGKTSGVGQFGVGFTAVRAVSDEIEIRSTTGSISFSARDTAEALREATLPTPENGVPVLRLVWPTSNAPTTGFDSEVVLTLRDDIDAAALMSAMKLEATDLLLELDGLVSIDVEGNLLQRSITPLPNGLDEVAIGRSRWWQQRRDGTRWLIPVVGEMITPVQTDVLRSPTRSDEGLSLPAIVVTDVAMQPDRRHIMPGANISRVADGYAELVGLVPPDQCLALVPKPGFARSEVDSLLREALLRDLMDNRWLPGVGDTRLLPVRANVLPGLTDELAKLLVDVVPDLVIPDLSGPKDAAILAVLDVHRVGLARLADMLSAVDRPPEWWGEVYAALEPLVIDGFAAEELATIPVPLSDGRTVTGPRTTVLALDVDADSVTAVHWARLVHPAAAHPLLQRLGAGTATVADLLSDPSLEAEIEDLAYDDPRNTVDAVLRLAKSAAGVQLPSWLGFLPLRDSDAQVRSADELLLPGAPLADLLVEDSPFGIVDPALVDMYGEAALRAVGVGWSFFVVHEDLPTGPDHDLDDESSWWDGHSDEPAIIYGVRDLDLVDDQNWPAALHLLLQEPNTRSLVTDRNGYTAWWLRTHAVIGGQPLGGFRSPSDVTFAGLLDALDHPDADALAATLAPSRIETPFLTQLLIDRLGEPTRSPSPAVIASTHALLAETVESGRVDISDIDLPRYVRSLGGGVVDPGEALVLDKPWFGGVLPIDIAVLGSFDTAPALAELLDLPLASQAVRGDVLGTGRTSTWDREPGAVLACAAMGLILPAGRVVVHDELVVRLSGALDGDRRVPWWITEDVTVHCTESWDRPRGAV